MKNRQFLLIAVLLFTSSIVFAQKNKADFYYIANRDTVFCSKMSYNLTRTGYLKELDYVDLKGKAVGFKGKDLVPDVTTFYVKGTIYDKVPLKANKPNSYIEYTPRIVGGKLTVYKGLIRTTGGSRPLQLPIRFFIKMPDGKYYKINKKRNMKKVIIPYLMQCKAFTNKYKGDYSNEEQAFIDMIKLYNSVCK